MVGTYRVHGWYPLGTWLVPRRFMVAVPVKVQVVGVVFPVTLGVPFLLDCDSTGSNQGISVVLEFAMRRESTVTLDFLVGGVGFGLQSLSIGLFERYYLL